MKRFLSVLFVTTFATFLLFASTTNITFDDEWTDTDWTYVEVLNTCTTTGEFAYSATGGNPTHQRVSNCTSKSDELDAHVDWTGTWEDLGVTSGDVVSTIQMTGLDTYCTTYYVCLTMTMGPLQLRDSGDSLVATLWTGRTATEADADWVAEGSQSAQSVGSLTASNSSIELWLTTKNYTGNDNAASCIAGFDNLALSIEHTTPASVIPRRIIVTSVRFSGDKIYHRSAIRAD